MRDRETKQKSAHRGRHIETLKETHTDMYKRSRLGLGRVKKLENSLSDPKVENC